MLVTEVLLNYSRLGQMQIQLRGEGGGCSEHGYQRIVIQD